MTILGVKVDPVTIDQTTDQVVSWLKNKSLSAGRQGKHYIVTTNVEFIMLAQRDSEFKKILNQADLSISDSSRLDWAYRMECEKNPLKRLILWPFFLFPNLLNRTIPTTTGVDLMERLCQLSGEMGYRVGLLGGREGVAEKVKECLEKRYPRIKVSFTDSGGRVNSNGTQTKSLQIPTTDILFMAFGAPKQEKWIAKNIKRIDARVFIGVGGAFDYISGSVLRAPGWIRALGLEWLFRLFIQPWRIKRFLSLIEFIFSV